MRYLLLLLPLLVIAAGWPAVNSDIPTGKTAIGLSLSAIDYGAKGDGVTDDTAALQAAITASANKTLQLGPYRYLITAPLTSTAPIRIVGTGARMMAYASNCDSSTSAIVVRSDINALTLTGQGGSVAGVCFEMGTAANQRAAGYALKLGGTATTSQGGGVIRDNSVVFPYDGILVGGATTAPTAQTINTVVADNTVISPVHEGITVGRESNTIGNPGTTLRDNMVVCYSTSTTATGIALYDGSIAYYGGDSGAYKCNIGMKIAPGKTNLFQGVMGRFQGVVGDSSTTADLDIDTTNSAGAAFYLNFSNAWFSAISPTDTPVRIRNTAGGQVRDIVFSGSTVHMQSNPTAPGIDIGSGVVTLSISGSLIMSDTAGATAIKVAAGASNLAITGNLIGGTTGVMATGIDLPATGTGYAITGNNFRNVTTPISYPVTALTAKATISNNSGLDDATASVAAATTTNLPVGPKLLLTGAGVTITTLTGLWTGRELEMVNNGGVITFASGGNICAGGLGAKPAFTLLKIVNYGTLGCVSVSGAAVLR